MGKNLAFWTPPSLKFHNRIDTNYIHTVRRYAHLLYPSGYVDDMNAAFGKVLHPAPAKLPRADDRPIGDAGGGCDIEMQLESILRREFYPKWRTINSYSGYLDLLSDK